MAAIAALLLWVRMATGRWTFEILMSGLPDLGLG